MGLIFVTSGINALLPLGSKVLIDFIIMKEGFKKVEDYLKLLHLEKFIDPARYFLGSLNLMIITALILGLIIGITGLLQRYLTFKFQQESVLNMQTTLFDHLLSFPLTFFKGKQTGYLMSRVSDDINRIQLLFSYSIPQITSSLFYLSFGIIILFTLNIKLSLILICVIPFYVLINYFFAGRLRSISWRDMEKSAGLSGNFQEAISGIELIKSFAAEKREVGKVSATLRNVMRTRMKHTILSSISNYTMSGSRLILTLLIVWLGVHEKSKGTMTVGDFVAFTTYILFLSNSMNQLSSFFIMLQPIFAAMHRIMEIFRMIPEFDSNRKSGALIRPEKIRGEIEFKDVSFAYEEDRPALTDISFKVNPGNVIAIVGHSGAGKTTLINLLLKFYSPKSGSILLDGNDLKDIDHHWLRHQIGVVSQETFLFHDTIENNIKYGRPSATREEVIAAARKAHIHNDIESFPGRYDTKVGERGSTLSVGQKQRISIARAFLKDPKILIFDESTSALDAETEGLIKDSFNELIKDRTTFIISHRKSVVDSADKIVVLDKGRII
ncbi:MAG: ABC transporter ATP-binding protein [Nitrospirae bacterium]|nr:ABC transporter ATP-binding protein [Nitrospirota bacterium]